MALTEPNFAESGAKCTEAHNIDSGERGGKGRKGECRFAVNHTNTTRSYISSNHDGALPRLEFIQNPITLILLLISMDCYEDVSRWFKERTHDITYTALANHLGAET